MSNNGKGSKSRVKNFKSYRENFDSIFKNKSKKELVNVYKSNIVK